MKHFLHLTSFFLILNQDLVQSSNLCAGLFPTGNDVQGLSGPSYHQLKIHKDHVSPGESVPISLMVPPTLPKFKGFIIQVLISISMARVM
jgi:hypothetical protein